MALALTLYPAPDGADNSQRRTSLNGTGKFTGSYVAGGVAINWLTVANSSGGDALLNSLSTTPLWAEFQIGIPGSTPLYYILNYNYSTNKLQVADTGAASGSGFAEFAAGAYSADLLALTVYFKAEFRNEA